MKLLIVILFPMCLDLISAGSLFDNAAYMDTPQMFCGSKLTIEMSIICQGWYNDDKRSQPKIKRGIVDECCTVPCTRRYLKQYYCGTIPETTTRKVEVTTEQDTRIQPVNYDMYYYALIGRAKAEYPRDYPRYYKELEKHRI